MKLEVGKKYLDRKGRVVKILRAVESYKGFPFEASNNHYYKDDGMFGWSEWHLDLIEEYKEYQEEQPQMNKGYAVTNNNMNNFGRVGVEIPQDSDTTLIKLKFADETTGKYKPSSLTPCTYKEVQFVKEPASKLIKVLEDSGYELSGDGWSRDDEDLLFTSEMLYFCGKEPDTQQFGWRPEWLDAEYAIVDLITLGMELMESMTEILDWLDSIHLSESKQVSIDKCRDLIAKTKGAKTE